MASALDKLGARASAQKKTAGQEILIALEKLKFDPTQPRQIFHAMDGVVDEEAQRKLAELAESIKINGLIQAITVQELQDGSFLVVVGERRARAHLLNGETTIRAIIRNDLTNKSRRLIYQLAENVDRDDLTDEELARAVRELLDSGDDGKPMSHGALAERLGKSPGWLSRYVKYGDEELQRLWVRSGICDSVEKVYRISILPMPVQLEILRRVDLPEGHPERLEKPLNRNVIDALGKQAKAAKVRGIDVIIGGAPTTPDGSAAPAPTGAESNEGGAGAGQGENVDAIGAALREAASEPAVPQSRGGAAPGQTSYSLPEDVRQTLLSTTHDGAGEDSVRPADLTVPPVHCRMPLQNMSKLLEILQGEPGSLDAARGVRCDLVIPGMLAAKLANTLSGVTVDSQEVAIVLQKALGQLG